MKIVAYLYSDPLLEPAPDPAIWGWEVDRVYQDLGVKAVPSHEKRRSAALKEPRQQLQQLLQDCQVEPVDYLLVRRLEELGDSTEAVSNHLAQLEALGVQLIAIEQPYSSAQAQTVTGADLLKLLQQIQQEQRSRRIRQGHARNRVKALPPPGKAPYGYRRGKDRYALDRAAAPVVKDFFEQFLLYGSLRGAVRYLEKKYGKKISASTGQRWLTSPVYRGDLEYQNGQVVSDTHAAIVSREEAAQVDRLLRRNRRCPPELPVRLVLWLGWWCAASASRL